LHQLLFDNSYDSYYIIRECKTHFGVDFLRNEQGQRKIKRCAYKSKIYINTEGLPDDFTVRTEKQVGQPLVFKREDFLTDYEIHALCPTTQEKKSEPAQLEIGFREDETPF